jgi:hypothetical protein
MKFWLNDASMPINGKKNTCAVNPTIHPITILTPISARDSSLLWFILFLQDNTPNEDNLLTTILTYPVHWAV